MSGPIKFNADKESKREIIRKAETTIHHMQGQIANQAASITRLLIDPDGVREIMRLQELLSRAEHDRNVYRNRLSRLGQMVENRLDDMDRKNAEKGYAPMLRDMARVIGDTE